MRMRTNSVRACSLSTCFACVSPLTLCNSSSNGLDLRLTLDESGCEYESSIFSSIVHVDSLVLSVLLELDQRAV